MSPDWLKYGFECALCAFVVIRLDVTMARLAASVEKLLAHLKG